MITNNLVFSFDPTEMISVGQQMCNVVGKWNLVSLSRLVRASVGSKEWKLQLNYVDDATTGTYKTQK